MLINVYVNGDWDTSLETQKEVVIFNRGIIYQMDEKLFDSFIDELKKDLIRSFISYYFLIPN